jgi:hypothetical protein
MEADPVSYPRTSNAAVASLICGLLGCIPLVTGAAAVVLGVFGIKTTNDRRFTGRGMAIAGLILGVLSVGFWTLVLVDTVTGVIVFDGSVGEEQAIAEQFARDLSEGKVDAALASTVDGIDRAMLVEASEQMRAWGTLRRLDQNSVLVKRAHGVRRTTLGGDATFDKEHKAYSVRFKKVGEKIRVETFSFQ